MNFLKRLESKTDGWWLKTLLKPYYMKVVQAVKYRRENKRIKREGEGVLHIASKALSDIGVFHWLEFGTLLGVIRDGKLIAHDTDLDFGVWLEDSSEAISSALVRAGFKQVHRIEIDGGAYGLEESYELNGVMLDLFYFTKTNSGMYCHLFPVLGKNKRAVREIFTSVNEFKSISWQSLEVQIPINADQRLRDTYGEYWVPNKGWNTPNQALNSEIISKAYTEKKSW